MNPSIQLPAPPEHSTVLVTGGAGFIGSNLVEHLLNSGVNAVCFDNFATGSRNNLAPFMGNPRFRLVEGDLRSASDCRKACEGVTHILHEAALGSVPRSIADPEATLSVNVTGFVNMISAAHKAGIRRFVFASSSSVYGSDNSAFKVESRTGRPLSPYAVSKVADELLAANFSELHGIETAGLRYFNVFGRRQNPFSEYAAVIPKFVSALIARRRPEIYGDGTISRDFTYIDNVIAANVLAMSVPLKDRRAAVCNVACGGKMSIGELFRILRENLAAFDPEIAKVEPVFAPPRPGDIADSCADVTLAHSLFGYSPLVRAREGLRLASGWYYETFKKKG